MKYLISVLLILFSIVLKYSNNSGDAHFKKYWWILLMIGFVSLIVELIKSVLL